MIIHCSICDATQEISTETLSTSFQVIEGQFLSESDPLPSSTPGIPYNFHELVKHIAESLPTWKAEVVKKEKEEVLKMICPKHLLLDNFLSKVDCPHYI